MTSRLSKHITIIHKTKRLTLASLLAAVCLLLTASCQDIEVLVPNDEVTRGDTYISMMICVDNDEDETTKATGDETTKATGDDGNFPGPDGGKSGDGEEIGQENENLVKNATLLLFKASASEMKNNNEVTTTYAEAFYFSSFTRDQKTDTDKNYYYKSDQVFKSTLALPSSEYRYLIIANCGNMCSYYKDMPLNKIKQDIVKNAWYSNESTPGVPGETSTNDDIKKFTNFVMTNEQTHSAEVDTDKEGNYNTDSYKTTTFTTDDEGHKVILLFEKIKRVAARIDFENESGTWDNTKNHFVYNVEGSNDKFVLTHVMPFNCYNKGSYTFEHYADKEGNITYLTDGETAEKTEDGKDYYNNNYVCDLDWGKSKSSTDYNLYLSATTNDSELKDAATGDWTAKNWANYKVRSANLTASSKKGSSNTDTYYILTYTNENTTKDNSLEYATGVLFRGVYYTEEEWNNGSPAAEAGTQKVYRYYLRHSDPDDNFNKTGVYSKEELEKATPMTFGIVRNNIYRVRIGKVVKIENEDIEVQPVLKVKPWTKFTHDEIEM